jgi:hypothetical protein
MSEEELTFRAGPGWQPACLPAGSAGSLRPRRGVPPCLPTFTRQVSVLPALIATTHRAVPHECDLDRLCAFASVRRGAAAIVQGVVFTEMHRAGLSRSRRMSLGPSLLRLGRQYQPHRAPVEDVLAPVPTDPVANPSLRIPVPGRRPASAFDVSCLGRANMDSLANPLNGSPGTEGPSLASRSPPQNRYGPARHRSQSA